MMIHAYFIALLLSGASALLFYSNSLEEDIVIAVNPTPIASVNSRPSGKPNPSPSGQESKAPTPPKATPKPTPKPSPTPTPTPLPAFGIAATSPKDVLREAKMTVGRVDPFKSIVPPDLPELETAISPDELSFIPPPMTDTPSKGVKVYATPDPNAAAPGLVDGLVLKAIINGGLDPVAIVEVEGNSELIHVGERLPGNILVTSILYKDKSINLSRGQQTGILSIETDEDEEDE